MKKHTEKPPIDDLFARKLGNTSLPPSRDGFERLKSRMKQNDTESRVVFWRNPGVQRYMAVAACLLLVCLFGWLYLAEDNKLLADEQVAISKPAEKQRPEPRQHDQSPDAADKTTKSGSATPDLATPRSITPKADVEQLMASSPLNSVDKPVTPVVRVGQFDRQTSEVTPPSLPVAVAQTQPVTDKATPADPEASMPEQVAGNVAKPAPSAERVLVVTIAEPASLVAARQVANESVEARTAVAVNEKSEKETKAGTLWQQVNRIRQGEVFARRDNSDDERGLLGRAYNGLKHSLDKDKPAKQ